MSTTLQYPTPSRPSTSQGDREITEYMNRIGNMGRFTIRETAWKMRNENYYLMLFAEDEIEEILRICDFYEKSGRN